MFELYLAGSELAFRRQDHFVWQLQVARGRQTVPLTRDYIAAAERMPERSREDAD
jgi:cyclopropane-fatty-acyl-phospholipid synthase